MIASSKSCKSCGICVRSLPYTSSTFLRKKTIGSQRTGDTGESHSLLAPNGQLQDTATALYLQHGRYVFWRDFAHLCTRLFHRGLMEIAVATMMEWHRAVFLFIVITSQWFQWCDVSMLCFHAFPIAGPTSNSRGKLLPFSVAYKRRWIFLKKCHDRWRWSERSSTVCLSRFYPESACKVDQQGHSFLVEIY